MIPSNLGPHRHSTHATHPYRNGRRRRRGAFQSIESYEYGRQRGTPHRLQPRTLRRHTPHGCPYPDPPSPSDNAETQDRGDNQTRYFRYQGRGGGQSGVTSHDSSILVIDGGCTKPETGATDPHFTVGCFPLSYSAYKDPETVGIVYQTDTSHQDSYGRPALSTVERSTLEEKIGLNMPASELLGPDRLGLDSEESATYNEMAQELKICREVLPVGTASEKPTRDRAAGLQGACLQRSLKRRFGDGQDPMISIMTPQAAANLAQARGILGNVVWKKRSESPSIPHYDGYISAQVARRAARQSQTTNQNSTVALSAIRGNCATSDVPFASGPHTETDSGYGSLGPHSQIEGQLGSAAFNRQYTFRAPDSNLESSTMAPTYLHPPPSGRNASIEPLAGLGGQFSGGQLGGGYGQFSETLNGSSLNGVGGHFSGFGEQHGGFGGQPSGSGGQFSGSGGQSSGFGGQFSATEGQSRGLRGCNGSLNTQRGGDANVEWTGDELARFRFS